MQTGCYCHKQFASRQKDSLKKYAQTTARTNFICKQSKPFVCSQVGNRTLEAPPEGVVNVLVKPEGSREAHVRWDAPAHPNGRLTYSVHFTGSFYADQGKLCAILRPSITSENCLSVPEHLLLA